MAKTNDNKHPDDTLTRPRWLRAAEVRQQEFPVKLQGVDPEEVYAFRNRLADEVAALHREVAVLYQENHRLRETLRKWHAEHGRACDGVAEIYPNIGFW